MIIPSFLGERGGGVEISVIVRRKEDLLPSINVVQALTSNGTDRDSHNYAKLRTG